MQPIWKTIWPLPKWLNIVTILSNNPTPIYKITKGIENICSHKNLYTNVHSSIIHNSWKVKAAHVSINLRTERSCWLPYVQWDSILQQCGVEYWFSVDKALNALFKTQRLNSGGVIDMQCPKGQIYRDRINSFPGLGDQRVGSWQIMGTKFLSELVTMSWTLIVVMDTQHGNSLRNSGLVKGLTFGMWIIP